MDATNYLKSQIEREEKRMKEAVSPAKKQYLSGNISWLFERALGLIQLAEPGEVRQEALDFFLDRVKERPDLVRLREAFEKKDSRNWQQRTWKRSK